MKRPQEFSSPSPDTLRTTPSPVHKKAKTTPGSHGISVEHGGMDGVEEEEEGWTKVGKRKGKKTAKREGQHDVSSPISPRLSSPRIAAHLIACRPTRPSSCM